MWVVLLLFVLVGCTKPHPPLVTPHMPADLSQRDDQSTWAAPVVAPPPEMPVQPPVTPHAEKAAVPAEKDLLPLFEDGKDYVLEVAPGWPLTVMLEPGEHIITVVAGDRPIVAEGEQPPWDVRHSPPTAEQQHVFVTVIKPGLTMGLVIATNRRTYTLTLKAVGKTTRRTMRWRYPAQPVVAAAPRKIVAGPIPEPPYRLHIGYWMSQPNGSPEWLPSVYDDGQKMYLLFPVTTRYQEAPLVRGVGVNGPYLVNSRQVGRVVVVDQLAPRLELRIGIGEYAEVVQVVRGMLETIDCPGHVQCPQW